MKSVGNQGRVKEDEREVKEMVIVVGEIGKRRECGEVCWFGTGTRKSDAENEK